jgi:hypothetical protein
VAEIVSHGEFRTLPDEKLVGLIVERSNLDRDAARDALALIRGELAPNEVV